MNKKFFGTLLLGSLLLGGTFVSCKDYDDDIKNLQEQINNLATKSDVETKLSQLQSALTAAQSSADAAKKTAEDALAAAKAADNSAEVEKLTTEIKALDNKLAEIKDAQEAVNKALEATKKEVADKLSEFEESTKKLIADAQKKTEATVGQVADYVTDVDFLISNAAAPASATTLEFVTIKEKENVFGKDLPGAMTFVKDAQVQRPSAEVLVRVSPSNAELTPEMISLVNSKGDNLNDMLDIEVKRSDKLLTAPATKATNSAVWAIKATLKEYNEKAFKAAAATKDGNILYAVQVNNSLSVADSRYVTSSYELTLATGKYTPVKELNFWVGDKKVAEVNNRYAIPTKSSALKTGKVAPEYTWSGDAATAAITTGDKVNVKADAADDRSDSTVYALVQGEKLTIAIDQDGTATKAADAKATDIKGLYVTLDKENAIESAPSELNAWNSYSYDGLNTVKEGNKIDIAVTGATAVNDIIGFRVYAVNWDGTLVDPDGKAFYVKVGNEADKFDGVSIVKTPINEGDKTGESAKVTFKQLTGAETVEFVMDSNDEKVTLDVKIKVGKETKTLAESVTLFNTKDALNDAIIVATPDKDLSVVKDDKAYTGTIKVSDADGFVLYTIPVSYKKVLPTTTPEGFSVKTSQVVNNVYNCYLLPDAATNATKGTMGMDQIFNFPAKADTAKFEISFAESQKNANKELEAVKVKGTDSIKVAKDFVDNKTAHATSISYNYGKISSEKKDKDGKIVDYVVSTDVSFNTVYNCIYNDQFVWAYATREQATVKGGTDYTAKDKDGKYVNDLWSHELTYGTADTVNVAEFIYGKTPIDSKYSGLLSTLKDSDYNALTYKANTAKLITKANGQVNEYFTVTDNEDGVKFTVDPTSSNPTADVPSTLELTYTDAYGHDVVIKVDVLVKKR